MNTTIVADLSLTKADERTSQFIYQSHRLAVPITGDNWFENQISIAAGDTVTLSNIKDMVMVEANSLVNFTIEQSGGTEQQFDGTFLFLVASVYQLTIKAPAGGAVVMAKVFYSTN